MGQQLQACSSVCAGATSGSSSPVAPADEALQGSPPQVRLLAWIRRRNGAECNFAVVYEELFGSKAPVDKSKFVQVLKDRGFHFDAKAAFQYIDRHTRKGIIGPADFEMWQIEIEDREAEGLKNLRDFLKSKYPTPSAAYKELGKGEGDVLTMVEFIASMQKVGFITDDNLEELFRYIDKDFSGEVTFAEFKSVMRHAGNRKRSPGNSPDTSSRGKKPSGSQKREQRGSVGGRRHSMA